MPKQRRITIEDAASLFFADRKAQRMAPATLRFYRDKLGNFTRWCKEQGMVYLEDVTALQVRKYFASFEAKDYAPNTQNMLGRAVRAFLRWCTAEGLAKGTPMSNVRIPAPPKEVLPAIKPETLQKLLGAADARARAMILVLLDTGLRAREFVDLDGGDVDIDAGTVRVDRGKTGKARTAFISMPTVKALLAYYRQEGWPEDDGPLWRNQRTGGRLSGSGMRQALRETAKSAGVRGIKPHAFRRTFALWSLRQGVDIHTLAKLMGHQDITVLRLYLDLDDTDLLAAHRRANIVGEYLK